MRRLILFALLAVTLCACSMPRVIILNDPLSAEEHNDLGVAYQHRQEFDLAVREYEQAAELRKDWARPLINLGNVHAARNQWALAEKSYRQALAREPENAEAMNNLAWVLCLVRKNKDALAWAEKAVEAKPGVPAYLDTLAEAQMAQGNYEEARRVLDQALALDPAPELQQSLQRKKSFLEKISP